MTPLAPSFQLPFSLSPPVGGDPSFRPGSKVNQARPGTQGIHLPQGVAFHRSARSPDFAAVQLALHPGSGSREAGAKPPGPRVPSCCCRDGGGAGASPLVFSLHSPPVFDSLPCPPGHHSAFQPGPGPQHAFRFKFPPAGGSWWPGPPPRPQRSSASRPGGQGGPPVLRVTLAPRAPVRRRSPCALLHDRRGGPAGAPAAGIHLRGAPQLSPGLSPPNLNSPQQGDLGGQGLRHGPSAAPQAAQAVREGSRSSGSHSHLARRCGAAHPASSSTTGGGGSAGAPAAGIHFRGTPPASQPAAVNFVGAPKPTSDPPGASRSGRHLELLFTGAAGSPYEGEPQAFHRFAPTNFSTGPRDTGAPCTAFFRSLGPRWLRADDGGVQSTLKVRPPS
ncbi:hypothetical protein NDU88_008463 [Pleurodeles waltl]|uniref:Uncharacterized protein n=1 Tax=Pleurodeles waltl TaxID=8319 RepID=A0AAV7P0C7_PLEWA|nr:hypothetical protein NDU88_008463 [Pleurodeles waltl]